MLVTRFLRYIGATQLTPLSAPTAERTMRTMPLPRSSPSRRAAALRLATLGAAVALAGCQRPADVATARALVFLQQEVRRDTGAYASVTLTDDSTLVLEADASTRTRRDDPGTTARRIAAAAVRHWPAPRLRRVIVQLDTQARLGPVAYTSRRERYDFTAAEVAPPPALPDAPAEAASR